ncbi:uncharacterized protein HGUI_00199 [Hanseniaspora guilliermondii]|uniref:proline--tRNA ligase n=1 Tax=Hanseniaspora guilliermondii TaxID=56406 RepID=A0A1L0CTB8_9ASCO|nr:uncharacterized protein HGUI_00199 [Hanseniaspora guilliermondii]
MFTKNASSLKSKNSKIDEVQLLQSIGYIAPQNTGYYHYLPLGLRVLNNISKVIDKEFSIKDDFNYNIEKLELSQSSPVNLWKKTHRYPANKDEVFTYMENDKNLRLLNPTCEESITQLFKSNYMKGNSHLPKIFYQTTKKIRNEKRPRFGLIRTREFIMNDCYSFHNTPEDTSKFFKIMENKYRNIFNKLKIPVIAAMADSGDIGGSESIEFQYQDSRGEDTLLTCKSCHTGFNIEQFNGQLNGKLHEAVTKDLTFKLCWNADKSSLVAIYYPKGEELSINKVEEELGDDVDAESFFADREVGNQKIVDDINSKEDLQNYLFELPIVRMIDLRINKRGDLPDWPFKVFSKYQFMNIDKVDLCKPVSEAYDCPECKSENTINVTRSIEVGHIFNLGDRYTNKDNLKVMNVDDISKPIYMGCYGIGVSRLLQILAIENQDSLGINLPKVVTPYTVNFIVDNYKKNINEIFEEDSDLKVFLQDINNKQIEKDYYLDLASDIKQFDKAKVSAAVGIPINVYCNGKHTKLPYVEVEIRGDIIDENWINKLQNIVKDKDNFKVLREHKSDKRLPLIKINYKDTFDVCDEILKIMR